MIKVLLLSLRSHSNKTKCCFVFWYLFCLNNLNILGPRHKILSFSACSYCFMLFMLLFWLDWPQLMLAASWCAVLIVSRPVSSILPHPLPSCHPFFFCPYLCSCFDFLHTACYCQSSSFGHLLISHPFHSSLNSVNSSDSRGSSGSHSHSPSSSSSSSSHHLFNNHNRHRYRSSALPQQAPIRLSSISSHDSGFMSSSHDQCASSKSSSPMQAETKVRETPQSPTLNHSFGSKRALMK